MATAFRISETSFRTILSVQPGKEKWRFQGIDAGSGSGLVDDLLNSLGCRSKAKARREAGLSGIRWLARPTTFLRKVAAYQ
ncbi:hypothetical protein [Mesorhizobium sp. B2-7-1]|uniref:hypothetical protein n=1 Tax=Mesorhizobium sp. B2-7-1 TaxID=2589909 RepID=UPI0015E2A6A1|nr:hypothetical protein [Mesorhizobium sp. B2-7-1]